MGDEVLNKKERESVSLIDASKWIQLCVNYIHRVMKDNYQLRLFKEIADRPHFNHGRDYHVSQIVQMKSIIEACEIIPNQYRDIEDKYIVLVEMLNNFHKYVSNSRRRYNNRVNDCNKFKDEYDIQDAIHSILLLLFDNVKKEDFVPSHAGGNSRVDFFLPEIKTALEIKYCRETHKDKEITEEISIDVQRYKGNTQYEKILVFIYDPDGNLKNPGGVLELEDNNIIQIVINP